MTHTITTHESATTLHAEPNRFYATREDGTVHEVGMPFYVAPDCEASVLSCPPVIVRDTSEKPFVMLSNGVTIGPEREEIVKVVRLTGHNNYGRWDLVLVLTDEAGYVMRGADFDNQRWIDEIELAEASDEVRP